MGTKRDRAVTPVVGTVLIVAIVVVLASVVAVSTFSNFDQESLDNPQFSDVQITAVEADDDNIPVPELDAEGECSDYHLVITIEHLGGDDFTSDDLEYRIEAIGDSKTRTGSFTSDDANPGTTAATGDEIVIALDGDTSVGNDCDVGDPDESYVGLSFAGEPAWTPQQPEDDEGLGSLHNTFFSDTNAPDEELQKVEVTIIQDSTDTIIIDGETTDIVDRS